jgi:arabinose-5-phosphate isomerase
MNNYNSELIDSFLDVQIDNLKSFAGNYNKDDFYRIVNLLNQSKGKVVLTGVGKSGLVCRKIAATLSSTGKAACFMHPTEALHGDLGFLSNEDILIAIGKSGESDELNAILPAIRNFGLKIIAITGVKGSTLDKLSDCSLVFSVENEGCPNNLAPMASTTLTMVIGDCISVALQLMNNFSAREFSKFHPGGLLGRKLNLKAGDLMISKSQLKLLAMENLLMKDVLISLTESGYGVAIIMNNKNVAGIFTDGDVRRLIQKFESDFFSINPLNVMNTDFLFSYSDEMACSVLDKMEIRARPLNLMLLMNKNDQFEGIVRIHDLINNLK